MIVCMKTIVKIDPQKEYDTAKKIIESLVPVNDADEMSSLDNSIDNLKTVINVLIERATPTKQKLPPKKTGKKKNKKKPREEFGKLPSEKFPDLDVEENIVRAEEVPKCCCCEAPMQESGLYKTSEKLEVIPKKYYIVRHKRVVYNCNSCNGSMVNAPSVPSISKSSNYGDSIIIDAALSKYLDLIPMERYAAMAERNGLLGGLPPNSLISLTHNLAYFLGPIYRKLKLEVLTSRIILADETPHKMLEGDETANWFLWGFSSNRACVFQAHPTRSGDVPIKFLVESKAQFLLTDGYSGYKRALKEVKKLGMEIQEVFCNAHAYRYFRDASTTWESECKIFLEIYGKIYELEREAENEEQKKLARRKMQPLFLQLKNMCIKAQKDLMPNSSLEKAIGYFLNHFDGLTVCLEDIEIPLDNNFSERLLRSYVVGRKTWLGTHSKQGAKTSAVLFSLVETCKINKINPRHYFAWVIERLHKKETILTPYEYANQTESR